ncbi:MAG TPA: DinB family protein [Terriglobales bacterium]|nr:DinB family protein [Terriglobales bacterium]
MQETAQQYIARLTSYLEGKDFLQVLKATPTLLRQLTTAVADAELRRRPEPNKWSAMEQVAHLSDVEIVLGYRVRVVLGAEDGVPIPAFDQDRWQQAFRYNSRELEPTLAAFTAARENNLRLYESLSQAEWNKYGMHSERGKETVEAIVKLAAGHDINHLRQIEGLLGKPASTGTGR